ncbi:signal recognition particle protein [Aspergillus campestris IBT 28561]|uniref:Signal recognition particle subunit SRP72 n=1 Tax=Aspergillus campestris (strain IBT 28561) TaxID=1392248 RepID=A0A2I1CYI0_ASPC2|nr:signal recognition particle protein [Aspergillus campestris IBT 28561]PKY02687.1 signal recognition particle protein [Aspergillus campestris IBT 28561]
MTTQSLPALLQQSSIDDHDEALQSANAALSKSKSDLRATHVKAVALLKLDRYDDCLRVFEEAGDALKKRAALEYAYALYKCGKLEEATEVVAQLSGSGHRGAQHLEAQATYRAENFRRTAELYESLANDASLEASDLRINSWAADAQLQWQGWASQVRHNRPTRDDLEAFETVYNAACLGIARGEFGQAEVLLKRAKELCRTSEDLTPEDRAAELLPIAVQQLYVLIQQGKSQEAEAILEEISVDSISELSTRRIAQTNVTLVRDSAANPFLLYKGLDAAPEAPENDRLFSFQDTISTENTHAADLLVQKYDGIIRSTAKALSQAPWPSADARTNLLSVYNAAAHARGEPSPKALKAILPALDNRPKDLGLALTAVQLFVRAGNTTSAITTLERTLQHLEAAEDKSVRFNPGLLGILVSLYKLEGRKTQIRAELAKAATYWRTTPSNNQAPPTSLLRAAATSLLHSTDSADLTTARDIFQTLHQQNPHDPAALAGYIAAQAPLDHTQVPTAKVDSLPEVPTLIADVDLATLESAGIAPPASASAAAAAALAGARKRQASAAASAPKRVRKDRLPKDFDPAKTADPERWLPLRERSSYRPKGRKGKQRAAERTQGGVVSDDKPAASNSGSAGVVNAPSGGGSKKKGGKKGKR